MDLCKRLFDSSISGRIEIISYNPIQVRNMKIIIFDAECRGGYRRYESNKFIRSTKLNKKEKKKH